MKIPYLASLDAYYRNGSIFIIAATSGYHSTVGNTVSSKDKHISNLHIDYTMYIVYGRMLDVGMPGGVGVATGFFYNEA